MKIMNLVSVSVLMLVAQYSMADVVGLAVGLPPQALAAVLPVDMGGIVAMGAVSLIIGAQLIKRRK